MKRTSNRPQKIGDQIQRELVDLIHSQLKDPRIGIVTITQVEVSSDLNHAKVFFTAMTDKEHADRTYQALQHAAGFLRSGLAHRLKSYSVPTLHFVYDDSIEAGIRITTLIDRAVQEDRK